MNKETEAGCGAVGALVEPTVMQRADGGPAFPLCSPSAEWEAQRMDDAGNLTPAHWKAAAGISGMSLRDYFAAHALAGLLVRNWSDPATGKTPENVHELWAAGAYATADAMLAVRAA